MHVQRFFILICPVSQLLAATTYTVFLLYYRCTIDLDYRRNNLNIKCAYVVISQTIKIFYNKDFPNLQHNVSGNNKMILYYYTMPTWYYAGEWEAEGANKIILVDVLVHHLESNQRQVWVADDELEYFIPYRIESWGMRHTL